MKSYIALASALLIALVLSFYWIQLDNQHKAEIASYQNQVDQLLEEIDSRRDLLRNFETNTTQLESSLSAAQRENQILLSEISDLQKQIDPNYDALENELRQSIEAEFSRRALRNSKLSTKSELIRGLAALDPEEFGNILALQGQFGPFLSSLNLSDERLDIVVTAISNMMEDQNLERLALLEDMQNSMIQNSDSNRSFAFDSEFQQKMMAIDSEEAQLDALSYTLSDDELAAYQQFLDDRAEAGRFTSSSATFIGGTAIDIGEGTTLGGTAATNFPNGGVIIDTTESNIAIELIEIPQN